MPAAAVLIRAMPGLPPEGQMAAASAAVARTGLSVTRVYRDSGKGRRSGRHAALRDAGSAYTTLVVASLTVLGRAIPEIVQMVTRLRDRGVRLCVADADEGAVEALFGSAPLLADAHAALRREAILSGREKAKRRGVRFGRPRLPPEKVERAQAALAAGAGVREAARLAAISPASVVRLRDARTE